MRISSIIGLLGLGLLLGCGTDENPQPSQTANAAAASERLAGEGRESLTYSGDIRPILSQHCTGCHSSYSSYGGASGGIGEVIASIEKGSMPPKGNDAVPQEQLDMLGLWRDQGTPK